MNIGKKLATGAYLDMVVSLLEYVGYGRHVQRCYIFAVDGVSQAVNFKAVYL